MQLDRYSEINEYFNNIINDCEKCDEYITKKMIIFSLIDTLSQETARKDKIITSKESYIDNKSVFCNFILKYIHTIDYLEKIDPVSAYYDNQDLMDTNRITLNYLNAGCEYNVNQITELEESQKIINVLKSNKIRTDKYSYLQLLYKYRSKLVHEYRDVGNAFKSLQTNNEISYLSNCLNEKNITWRMTIPYNFLKKVLKEGLNNFLNERKLANEDPFKYSKEYLNWNEKY